MTNITHDVHGLSGSCEPAQWPALRFEEVSELLSGYAGIGAAECITWHSPRPLSAASLVQCANTVVFVKRHHNTVRTVATLEEEHRFIDHLRAANVPIPAVLRDNAGCSAGAIGDWIYEVHECAAGTDIYRDTMSWEPPASVQHALCAADPVAALQAQLPQRPALAEYLRGRDWQADLAEVLAPWHAAAQPRLAMQGRLWTHGDWHVSNLCWSGAGEGAQVTAIVDFGLAAATFGLFDLATAIERNAISWLHLERGADAVHAEIACALIGGYRQQHTLDADAVHLLADLLPLVHLDFALSEVEYFSALADTQKSALAYDTFLRGHAAWFSTPPGRALLRAIHDCA